MQRTLSLFDNESDVAVLPTGAELRDAGIEQAVSNANAAVDGWSEKALEFVRQYPHQEFMAEQIREYAYSRGLERPPHDRAWGGVIVTAKRLGLIAFARFAAVSNPKAHRTPASVWRKS